MKVSDLVYSWSNETEIPRSVQYQIAAMRQGGGFGDDVDVHNLEDASLLSIAGSLEGIEETLSNIERKINA